MRQLLAAMGSDIKPAGKDYIARCPVHGDKDFAMSIKQCPDGSVVAHCHACGANGLDLYRHLGLDLEELFGGKQYDKPMVPVHIQEAYDLDRAVVVIYRFDESQGKRINLYDKRRYKLALARIKGIEEKFEIR